MSSNRGQAVARSTTDVSISRRSRRSVATKLFQAATLAAALVPLSSVKADATTISTDCFYNLSGASCGAHGPHDGGMFFFEGDPYVVELKFDQVTSEGVVTIAAITSAPEDLTSRFSSEFEGWAPVPICQTCDQEYIDFQVTTDDDFSFAASGGRGLAATQGYYLYIYWLGDTNALFPNPRMLHSTTGETGLFDRNITNEYLSELDPDDTCFFFDVCGGDEFDPGAGGRDNMFSEFTLADDPNAAVPEPASLFLLGSGVSAMLYRRRRRSQKACD